MRTKENGKALVIVLIILAVILVILGGIFIFYKSSLKLKDFKEKQIEIKSGMGVEAISDMLEKEGIIKNSFTFKVYCKLNNKTMMQAGKYMVKPDMSLDDLLKMMADGDTIKDEITITFPEGKNMKQIAQIIAENTNNTEQDVMDLLKNDEYIDSIISEYWFVPASITNPDIYYPLEGYLYPDTYNFSSRDESVKNIFKKMLDKMDTIITPYRPEIEDKDYYVHEVLTLASVIELEAQNKDDRRMLSGVFFKRLEYNMPLQSDVTTYYGLQIPLNERDLTNAELSENNGYNTRTSAMNGKLPIGPICNVSESSIEAVLYPIPSDYLYFVADKNGKLYFSETYEDHNDMIQDLKDRGLWFTYDE